MGKRRERRLRLMEQDPHCHWCGVEVFDMELHLMKSRPPSNAATIDHVYSRLTEHRQKGLQGRWVLACWGCNQRRSIEEIESMPIEEWRKRCGRTGNVGSNGQSMDD
jgi:hypothetical protein